MAVPSIRHARGAKRNRAEHTGHAERSASRKVARANRLSLVQSARRACRECGCTQNRACPGGCWWVEPDLCSACAPEGDR